VGSIDGNAKASLTGWTKLRMRRAIDRAVKTDTVEKEKDRRKEEEPKVTAIATEAATISKDT
jgi:hypothetical protein